MWIADPRCPSRARASSGQRGFSFVEVTLVLAMTALLAWAVERTLYTTRNADDYLGAVHHVTERSQRMAYKLRELVSSSHRLFGRDADGQAYLDALDITRSPLDAAARLPLVEQNGEFVVDGAGEESTGNMLLFVRETDAVPALVDAVTQERMYIDIYRFVCIYPSVTGINVMRTSPPTAARDLVMWQSEVYPSHTQIMKIDDPVKRSAVVRDLVNRLGYEYAWDPSQPIDNAFYGMDALGLVSAIPQVDFRIYEDLNESETGSFVYSKLQLAQSDGASYHRMSRLTDVTGSWLPHGFETRIIGVSARRKVWMRLTIEGPSVSGESVVHASQLIAGAQDL